MNTQSTFLLGTTLIALVHLSLQSAVSQASPPLSEASAKAIFENGNHRNQPNVVPNLVHIASASPPPIPSSSPVRARVHRVDRPKSLAPVVNSPGIPDFSPIEVSVNRSVPLAKAMQENLINSSFIEERDCVSGYCCPDPRYLNENTAYPWNVIGQWKLDKGICTGTLVGPRHVLTASHCIDWDAGNDDFVGPIYFSPTYWPGHTAGVYIVTNLYTYTGLTPETEPISLEQDSFDYVIGILNVEPGIGWLGSKTYSTTWNGLTAWYQAGYAGAPGNGITPYAQNNFKVLSETGEPNQGELLMYTMCATPGDSGSAAFGWFSDGPALIGTFTKYNSVQNWGPAGALMVDLINSARSAYP